MKQRYFLPSLLAACLVGGAAPAGAQALNYFAVNAQTATTSYTDLGTAGTAIATPDFDDSNSAAQPLGFTFSYGGASYSQFVLNTNGYLKLGSAAPVAPYFSNGAQNVSGGPLNSADTNLLLPFNTDLEAGSSPPEYRVATTGTVGSRVTTIQWKNVSDKARAASITTATVVPKQFANFSFQVRLYEGSNAIEFGYGPATASANASTDSYVAVGLKGSGTAAFQATTVAKSAGAPWLFATFQDGGYSNSLSGFNVHATLLPDAGRTYRFNAAVPDDVALAALYNIEQLPVGQSFAYRAQVVNKGSDTKTNLVVTLSLSGAKTATATQTIASLAPGSSALVAWPPLALGTVGTTTVVASLPADATPADNSQTAATLTSEGRPGAPAFFSYTKPGVAANGSYGFGPTTAPYTGVNGAAYTTSALTFAFTTVRAQLGSSTTNVGQTVYGLLTDLSGKVLGQSADYTIQVGDLGTLHTFELTTPVTVPPGTTVLAGIGQKVVSTLFYATAYQAETPGRPGTFYSISNLATLPTPRDINASGTNNARFLLEAGGYGIILATAAPALTQALTVFPNPSATGQFSLDIHGAGAPAGLAVSVVNQLGQVVYTGTARDNATTPLDLSGLAPGLYRVQLRHGAAFASQPLSIVR